MTPIVWLSVDWDYFTRELAAWGFDHAEPAPDRAAIWAAREASFAAKGENLREAMSLRHAAPAPGAFWQTLLHLGYRFDKLRVIAVGDSHRWAARLFERSALRRPRSGPMRLVNFDAHHDLFYSPAHLGWSIGHGEPTCENWHLFTLIDNRKLESLVVFPAWKGDVDWQHLMGQLGEGGVAAGLDVKAMLEARVTSCVWPSPQVAAWAGSVERIYIARSGGWAPPWHDRAFRRFCLDARARFDVPLDTPFVTLEGGVDPLALR
jgi:hypothetical protein